MLRCPWDEWEEDSFAIGDFFSNSCVDLLGFIELMMIPEAMPFVFYVEPPVEG